MQDVRAPRLDPAQSSAQRFPRRLWWGGFLMGFGFGGLFDGVVLHQLLQWHHVVSSRVPPDTLQSLRANILADGLLNAVMTGLLLLGFALAWSARMRGSSLPRSGLFLLGLGVLGWGAFNVYDSLVHHWLLGLHHIREGAHHVEAAYDRGFFALALALLLAGYALVRRARR